MPRQPVFYAALAYAVGIFVGARCWRPMLWWVIAATMCGLGSVVLAGGTEHKPENKSEWLKANISFACVLLAFVALGALGIRTRNSAVIRPDMSQVTDGRDVIVTCYVVKDGTIRGAGAQRRESVDVQIEQVEIEPPAAGQPASQPVVLPQPKDRTGERRRKAACKANSVWSEDLLRASGIAGCEAEPKRREQHRNSSPEETESAVRAPNNQQPGKITLTPDSAIRLSIYSRDRFDESDDSDEDSPQRVFTYGQRLRFTARLHPPRNFGNAGALDYEGYLAQQDIYALGSVRMDRIEVLDGSTGSRWEYLRNRIRRDIVKKIHALWPEEQAALLDAMLIGEASFIGRATKTGFQRTGIYHILVVSGMNVAILATVVFWVLNRLRCNQLVAVVLTFLLSCGYAYVAESGAPIMRPVIMLCIFMCARLLYRSGAMLNSLGIAALVLMVYDPHSLTDASFQLTFVSVLAITGIAVPVIERTSGPYKSSLRQLALIAKDASLHPRQAQFRIDLRMITERLARFLPTWPKEFRDTPNKVLRERIMQRVLTSVLSAALSGYELLVVSVIAQITLTLPMAWYFHRVTVMSLPANLLAVPLVGILMPASVSALALGYLWKPLAYVPALITSYSLAGITKVVQTFGQMHTADLRVATPALLPAIAAVAAFLTALVLIRRNWILAIVGTSLVLASALWIAALSPAPAIRSSVLEVTSIDVGQAESSLVVTPEGKTLLVDAGGSLGPWQSEFDFGEDVVSPYLWARGITHLDAVCLTHAHSDHFGGMHAVMQNFHPSELWMGPTPDIPEIKALLKQASDAGMVVNRHAAGDAFSFGGASVTVLSPPRDWVSSPKSRNNDSLVLRFSYENTSALLEADAERQMEEKITSTVPNADVIKIAHNGSKTSSTPEFLSAVHPSYAVISVGARNSFGHPRREILERLAERSVSTYRTDMFGAVTFYLDGERITPVIRPQYSR